MLESSHDIVTDPLAVILLITQVTGFAYGDVRSEPDHVQVQSVAFVVFGLRVIFEISFPLGLVIVTVESVIVLPLRVVGAVKTTLGGN